MTTLRASCERHAAEVPTESDPPSEPLSDPSAADTSTPDANITCADMLHTVVEKSEATTQCLLDPKWSERRFTDSDDDRERVALQNASFAKWY